MKVGTKLQLAIDNMDRQVELAKRVGSEVLMDTKDVKKEVKEAKKAEGSLGNNVDTQA